MEQHAPQRVKAFQKRTIFNGGLGNYFIVLASVRRDQLARHLLAHPGRGLWQLSAHNKLINKYFVKSYWYEIIP